MIRFFSAHPTAANLLMIVFIVMGVIALPELRRETFPEFASSKVQVRVTYPGASAEEVEEAIVQRLEDALSGVENVKVTTAQAVEGAGVLILEMDEDAGDLESFIDDIRTEVDAISSFPEDAGDPVITTLARTDYVVSIAVTGPMSVTDLKDYTESLKRKLTRIPEVSLVSVSGFSDRQIRIQISAENLLNYGLNIQTIANKIVEQNLNRPVGSIESVDREISLRFKDQRRSIDAYRSIVILGGKTGAEIRLGDVATVVEQFENEEIKTIFNGERAGMLIINKTRAQDSLRILDAVKQFISEEQLKAPPKVKLTKTRDMASVVRERLGLLGTNGWQGLLLVFFSLWLFFSFRLSFWVTMGLPISFAGAIFVMNQIGYTLNMMTTVALIITLGLLMDDAIVIAENVAAHLQRGKTALNAAIDGVMEVRNGIISSFLTTACVFLPLAYLGGQMGRVLKVIPVVLLAVLAVSLVEAFFILPSHLAHSMKNHHMKEPGKFRGGFNRVMDWTRENLLGKSVDIAVRYRYLTAGILIALFLISIGTFSAGMLKFVGFPKLDEDSLEVKIYLPPGTPLQRTEKVVARILKGLDVTDRHFSEMQPSKKQLIQEIRVSYSQNSDVTESGPHLATIYVDLLGSEDRVGRIDNILAHWRKQSGKIPDAISISFDTPQRGPSGNAIEIEFQGEDLKELKAAAGQVSSWLIQFDGVYDLHDNLRPGKPEIQMKLKQGASLLNLSAANIANQLGSAFQGTTAAEIQIGRNAYEIDVRLNPESRDSLSDLDRFKLTGSRGEKIPLESVVEMTAGRGYSTISHVDGLRTVTLYGSINLQVANTREIMNRLQNEFIPKVQEKQPGIQVLIKGESANNAETGNSMLKALMIGLLGVFILLSFQFRSYMEPLVVMLAIPFSLIGVIWGHLAMGIPLSMPSLLGYISLTGIVVNDSILLVIFIRNRINEGKSIESASKAASRERFRAILLTSLTTIIGLIPLLSETSLQAQMIVPIATSIAFGMASSTVLVLIAIPCFYTILGDFGLTRKTEDHDKGHDVTTTETDPETETGGTIQEVLEAGDDQKEEEPGTEPAPDSA